MKQDFLSFRLANLKEPLPPPSLKEQMGETEYGIQVERWNHGKKSYWTVSCRRTQPLLEP